MRLAQLWVPCVALPAWGGGQVESGQGCIFSQGRAASLGLLPPCSKPPI